MSTTLTHRYRRSSDFDRTRLVVHARVLLVRDAQGIWRLTAVEPLLPLVAVTHRHRDGLVLSLPEALERPATVTLRIERGEISYSDDARLAG